MRRVFKDKKDKDKKPRRGSKFDSIIMRKKFCRFCQDDVKAIDYKDLRRMERFVTERGKVLPSRISGNCVKHQRRVAVAIKRARYVGLLPYVRA